ncbi:MAG: LysM peptidoglycan-binding domain-containing protein [Lentisphaeria bacterium]|nr:LysM peptidoglycan-binding domain-containing protein [Lentisphaeria bacterium]
MKKIPLKPENRDKQKKIRKKVAEGDPLETMMGKPDQAAARVTKPVRMMGYVTEYRYPPEIILVVQAGDTLSSIARKYGTTAAKLKKLNGLTDEQAGQLKAGQQIRLK